MMRRWCFALAVAAVPVAVAAASPDEGMVCYVTDADTLRLTTGERIRVAGIDAPETHAGQAKCALEMKRCQAAATRLWMIIDGRTARFKRVGRSYNRTVATVTIAGRDLADSLLAAGAAKPWPRSRPKPYWCH